MLGDEVRRRHGHAGFDVRVGLHTGTVLLGGGVSADGSIRGIAVNIAARMEQSAPAGALRISHDTYRHVRGVFDVEPQPPMQVKGIDEPIVTYLVLRAKPRAFRVVTRGIEGVETRMVGRDAELDLLKDAFERLYQQPRLAAASVVAEAGIGKSRLLYEFQNWAEARAEQVLPLPGAGPAADARPALRPAARPAGMAAADCRQRQHGGGQAEIRAGHARRCSNATTGPPRRRPMPMCWGN